MQNRLDEEAAGILSVIKPGHRLVVIGSTSFWGLDSPDLCLSIASELSNISQLVVVTGGMDGVGLTFGRAFSKARQTDRLPENVFHLLPRGLGPCDCGITLGAGIDFHERRELLGRIGHTCLVIEGGPGTEHEATVASDRRIPIIPLGRSGGHAAELHARISCPSWAAVTDWALLGDTSALHGDVVAAVGRLVRGAMKSPEINLSI